MVDLRWLGSAARETHPRYRCSVLSLSFPPRPIYSATPPRPPFLSSRNARPTLAFRPTGRLDLSAPGGPTAPPPEPTSGARHEAAVPADMTEWTELYRSLTQAGKEGSLEPDDLERLATAAWLTGRDDESAEAWAEAHRVHLEQGRTERAVRCAFWLASSLSHRGERARGGGWVGRARRLLDECSPECVERGYLLIPEGFSQIMQGDGEAACDTFIRAYEIGERCGDSDLTALALHSRGRVLIRLGRVEEGVALLDEAMAAVEAQEVSPVVVGEVYCSVIEGCLEIFDLPRAGEWTAVLTRWCEARNDLVPYRGQCLIYRAEVLQLQGEWPDALAEAQRASERLTRPPGEPAAGAAFYREAELHRLRGEWELAEEAYRRAGTWGRNPQPGLALLRIVRGEVDTAVTALQQALDRVPDEARKAPLLSALVEAFLAQGEVEAAGTTSRQLREVAGKVEASFLRAAADQMEGAVLLARGQAEEALPLLRRAEEGWRGVEVPYGVARTRFLIGLACRKLGDRDTGDVELEGARRIFRELGARPDLTGVERLLRPEAPRRPGGLTRREIEVLRLVAAGKTNRQVADELYISERTVARHVSNIFRKLGLSTRSAATAWAWEQELM